MLADRVSADEVRASAAKSAPSDEEELQSQANMTEDDSSEYEYVPVMEASQGVISKVVSFLKSYALIIFFVAVSVICIILSKIGSSMSTVFIAIAFGFIAAAIAFILYDAWRNKKAAEAAYKHARDVRDPVKRKMMEMDDN